MEDINVIDSYAPGIVTANRFDILLDETDPPGEVQTLEKSRKARRGPNKTKQARTCTPKPVPADIDVAPKNIKKKEIRTQNVEDFPNVMTFADYTELRATARLHAKHCLQSKNTRKAGEGDDQKRWEKLVPLNNKREEVEVVAKVVETAKVPQRADRIKRVNNVTFTINSDYGRNFIGHAPCLPPKREEALPPPPPPPPAFGDTRQFPALGGKPR